MRDPGPAFSTMLYEDDPPRDTLLAEREVTHGSFKQNAAIWDEIMYVFRDISIPSPEHRLALTMIALKLSRMASHPDFAEHWLDIAGYAKLGMEACAVPEPYASGKTKVG